MYSHDGLFLEAEPDIVWGKHAGEDFLGPSVSCAKHMI